MWRDCLKHDYIRLHPGPGCRWPDLPMSLFAGMLSACHGIHGLPDDHVTARQGPRRHHARQRTCCLQKHATHTAISTDTAPSQLSPTESTERCAESCGTGAAWCLTSCCMKVPTASVLLQHHFEISERVILGHLLLSKRNAKQWQHQQKPPVNARTLGSGR